MKENNKKYNAIDFALYHSGAMPPDEMHALEKAALEDPFLADALEGYAFSKDPEKELDEIRKRLDEKRKQSKVFSISSISSGSWWKIAAMFILFAGIGYFFYATNSRKENSLAVKETVEKKETPAIISPRANDTAASEGNLAFEKPSTEKDRNNLAKLPAPVLKSLQPAPKNSGHDEERIKEEKIFSEKQLTAKRESAMAMSTDKIKSADITIAESREKSFDRLSDTTASEAVSPNVSSDDSGNMVAMNKKNGALNEVVVTGYGTQKKKDLTRANTEVLQGKVSGVQVNYESPYPKEGKEKFDKYIKDNAIPVLDSNGNRIAADILLSFKLDKKDKPNHIKVIESSCKVCEKEAVRLLEDGPVWVGKQGEKGTVRIQF
ncbi:MAG TPA: hypothetical protein VIJ75_15780 [Hanamia sp.]